MEGRSVTARRFAIRRGGSAPGSLSKQGGTDLRGTPSPAGITGCAEPCRVVQQEVVEIVDIVDIVGSVGAVALGEVQAAGNVPLPRRLDGLNAQRVEVSGFADEFGHGFTESPRLFDGTPG